jgi:hypothetical protein
MRCQLDVKTTMTWMLMKRECSSVARSTRKESREAEGMGLVAGDKTTRCCRIHPGNPSSSCHLPVAPFFSHVQRQGRDGGGGA